MGAGNELHGDIVVGFTNKGQSFYFDSEDYELVTPHCWYMNDLGYLETRKPNGKLERMHRLIMHASKTELIDHINHSTNDNRKCNLRKVTKGENTRNSGLSRNNTSGVTGVFWNNRRGKWSATLFHNWRRHDLGRFDSFDDAVAARKAAEEKYFGEYSYSNSIAAVPHVQLN